MSKIPIKKNMIPYSFDISLGDELFRIIVNYNSTADMFTVGISKGMETICEGAPVIYGRKIFECVSRGGLYPAVDIIPYDISGNKDKVTWDNFGETVFLYIDDGVSPIEESETV
jgi:hypothetical protein